MGTNNNKSDPLDSQSIAFRPRKSVLQILINDQEASGRNLSEVLREVVDDGLRARRQESSMAGAFEELKQDLRRIIERQEEQDQTLQHLEGVCWLLTSVVSSFQLN